MSPLEDIGRLLIFFGLFIVLIGGLFLLGDKLHFFGRLPGDIIIKRKNFTFYFPLGTSILLSIILSLILWLINRR